MAFGAACAIVSWVWFFALSITGHVVGRAVVGRSSLRLLNRASAVMMWAASIYLVFVVLSFR